MKALLFSVLAFVCASCSYPFLTEGDYDVTIISTGGDTKMLIEAQLSLPL